MGRDSRIKRDENDAKQTHEPTLDDITKVTGLSDAVADTTPLAPPIDNEITLPGRDEELDAVAAAIPPPNDVNARMLAALESLESRKDEGGANGMLAVAIASLAESIRLQTEAQIQSSKNMEAATRRGQNRNNEQPHLISDFNPRGDKDFPRPKLVCQMFIPYPAEPESLTREEIELLNLASALAPGQFTIRRNDMTKIKLTLSSITKLDSPELSRFAINHETAFNNDYFRMMAPLCQWLRELLRQSPITRERAANILTMDEELAFIIARKFNDGTVAKADQSVVSIGEL